MALLEEHAAGDRFGAAVMSADFKADGIDDLAVGSPGRVVGSPAAGQGVTLGSPESIESNAAFVWGQLSIGEPGSPGDGMGSVLPK